MRSLAVRLTVTAVAAAGAVAATPLGTAHAAAASGVSHHPRIAAQPRSAAGWSSSNWSGYAITGGPFTSVTGTWKVPAVSQTRKQSYSSSWVGIDGFSNNSLIQTGTEQDWYSGAAHYAAWWEILPAAETRISMTVAPGDVMSASITQVSPGSFTISLQDVTRNEKFSITQAYSGPLTSAEWIQEAPTVGGHVATLAHYASPVTFDPGTVNGGASPHLVASNGGVMIQQGQQVSTPSLPDGDGDGFNVAYGSAAPAAPAS